MAEHHLGRPQARRRPMWSAPALRDAVSWHAADDAAAASARMRAGRGEVYTDPFTHAKLTFAGRPGALAHYLPCRRCIDELLRSSDEPVFSFEFFPPKSEQGEVNLAAALTDLVRLEPAFVSVTYGAGGSTREKTIEIVSRIERDFGLEAMAHLTCVNATVDDLRATLDKMRDAGIDNVLALRGDPPQGQERWTKTEGGLEYSLELIGLLREHYAFSIGGAAFPETHIHATSPEEDLRFLKAKVDAGAQFLITQMFFDNRYYFEFIGRARAIGIDVPIIPGVMPVLSRSGIRRMAELSKARLPDGLQRALEVRDDEAIAEFGVSYATLQCAELLAGGAPGIHFITLNRSPATRAILAALTLMRPWDAARTALEEHSLALG